MSYLQEKWHVMRCNHTQDVQILRATTTIEMFDELKDLGNCFVYCPFCFFSFFFGADTM